MKKFALALLATLSLSVSGTATAAPIIYNGTIDTSAFAGTNATLSFLSDRLLPPQIAINTRVRNFSGATIVAPPTNSAGVTGDLSSELVFLNPDPNDTTSLTDVVLGNTLNLQVEFSGPGIDTPNNDGNRLALALRILDTGNQSLIPGLNAGPFNFLLFVESDGSSSVGLAAPVTTFNQDVGGTVPVPGILALMLIGLFGMKRYLPKRTTEEEPQGDLVTA